jgi:hypothetical protein
VSPVLPWTTTLLAPSWPLTDEWTGIKLGVACGPTSYGVLKGTLLPEIGDFDGQGEHRSAPTDEADNTIKFTRNGGSGAVVGGSYTMTIVGTALGYKLGSGTMRSPANAGRNAPRKCCADPARAGKQQGRQHLRP